MSSQRDFVLPPRLAVWLVSLFAPTGEAESMVGDLLEEFSQLASRVGLSVARRWYWRQTVKTILSLLLAGFRSAPRTITAVVIGGFLLRWFVSWWSNPVMNRAIEAVLEKYQVYEHDPHVYLFWLTHTFLFERLLANVLIGVFVAFTAKGREMTATVMLGLVSAVLAVQSVWRGMARTGDQGLLGTLPWSFAFYLALVVGGAIVRILRLRTTIRPLAT
jgi:hypothetical protein